MRLKFTALALAATLFGCAPADWVDPSSVSQRYEVFYEELGSIFDAEAVFQSDQGPIVLADPSQVHLDEVQFTKISDDPSYIRQVRGQAFQASHVWRWVDSDGRSYENRFSLIPLPTMLFHLPPWALPETKTLSKLAFHASAMLIPSDQQPC